MNKTPIAIHNLGIDPETGLERSIIVTSFYVRAMIENIQVEYYLLTYSPTGVVVRQEGPFSYERFNDPNGSQEYDYWKNSQIGGAITAAILGTIQNYPNLGQ